MKNNDPNKFEVLASVLHGEEISHEESSSGFSTDDQDFNALKKIYDVKNQVSQLNNLTAENVAWEKVQPRISPKRILDWKRIMRYAAVFVGAIIITSAFHFYFFQNENSGTDVYASVNAPRGQITSLTLFDGTTVWLNSGSTLKYSDQYGKKERNVSLEGEALFEVKKDQQKPFVVQLGDSKVLVHGTVFNAKNYDSATELVLLEGKIEFINGENNIIMKPNDRLVEYKQTGKTSVDRVNASIYSSWIGGKIYFDNESLLELSLRLERWYDMEFVFEKEHIKSYKFTGVINKDKSLEYSMRIIQLTNKVKFRKERDKIIITE